MSARDKLRAKNEERKHNLTDIQDSMTSVVDDIMEKLPVDDNNGVINPVKAISTPKKKSENPATPVDSIKATKPVNNTSAAVTEVVKVSDNDIAGDKNVKPRAHEKTQSNPKGAGRPFNEVPKTVTSFSLCELSLRQLKELSMDNRVGMNRIVEIAVNEYMKKMDPDSTDRLQKKWGYEINPELSGESYIKL